MGKIYFSIYPTFYNSIIIYTIVLKKQSEPTIEELIAGCVKNQRFAQGQLYALFSPKMYVVCLRYSRNQQEAEECLQEGFMKIFTCIEQYKFMGSFEGWVRKIMVNCALQKFRSRPILYAIPHADINDLILLAPEDITGKLNAKELLEFIQKLSPAYRLVFNLYAFEGMKHREIADLLGISEGTSKSNLYDARKILQKMVTNSLKEQVQNINYYE